MRSMSAKKKIILKGIGASPGKVRGKIKLIKFPEEIDEFDRNHILVVDFLTPEFLPFVHHASGILAVISNKGGMTCHAAIVMREHRIPFVAGCQKATKILKNDSWVTLDGKEGIVYGEI